jgi:hypothetical protein
MEELTANKWIVDAVFAALALMGLTVAWKVRCTILWKMKEKLEHKRLVESANRPV